MSLWSLFSWSWSNTQKLPGNLWWLYDRATKAIESKLKWQSKSQQLKIQIVQSELSQAIQDHQQPYWLYIWDTDITNWVDKYKNAVMKWYTLEGIILVLGELRKAYPTHSIQLSSNLPELTAKVLSEILSNE